MTGPESDKFCLRWNDFESNLSSAIQEVREEKELYDVTVACDGGGEFPAHRLVLSACSLVLRQVLCRKSHLAGHQVVYLRGVNSQDLKFILSFMYQGEVSLAQHQLNSFLAVAEDLQVKGLTQSKSSGSEESSKQFSPIRPPAQNNQPAFHPRTNEEIKEINPIIPITPAAPIKQESRKPAEPGLMGPFHDNKQLVNYENGENIYDEYGSHYDEHNLSYGAGSNTHSANKVWNMSGSLDPDGMFERRTEGDFICVQCGYTNKWKHNMLKHIEVHVDGPGHECKFCFRNFKTKNSLQSHVSMKHREEKHNSL